MFQKRLTLKTHLIRREMLIDLDWNNPHTEEIDGYELQYADGLTNKWQAVSPAHEGDQLYHVHEDTIPGTTYHHRLRTIFASGAKSEWSNVTTTHTSTKWHQLLWVRILFALALLQLAAFAILFLTAMIILFVSLSART